MGCTKSPGFVFVGIRENNRKVLSSSPLIAPYGYMLELEHPPPCLFMLTHTHTPTSPSFPGPGHQAQIMSCLLEKL